MGEVVGEVVVKAAMVVGHPGALGGEVEGVVHLGEVAVYVGALVEAWGAWVQEEVGNEEAMGMVEGTLVSLGHWAPEEEEEEVGWGMVAA